jgi:hypothetical protein
MRPSARRYQWVWDPDTYRLLVLERGWTLEEYERWFTASLAAALLPSNTPAG